MSEWFVSRNGTQEGPLTAPQVQAWLSSGGLRAGEALAWKEGMPEWKPLAESGVLKEAALSQYSGGKSGVPLPSAIRKQADAPLPIPSAVAAASAAPAASSIVMNPYTPPAEVESGWDNFDNLEYPGIGRTAYIGWSIGMTGLLYGSLFATFIVSDSMRDFESTMGVFIFLALVVMVVGLVLGVKRVRNLGMSGWGVLWLLVPFINLWISWRMVACPAGYDHHRKLDTAGKVLTVLMIVFWLLSFGLNIAMAFMTDGGSQGF